MNTLPYRTIVYVDGFNFFYGAVRGTPWKWLDPVARFRRVLGPQNALVRLKYFTARARPSPSDPDVNVRQDAYLRALQAHCRLAELYFLPLFESSRHYGTCPPPASVGVYKNVDKGSDVNLALHVLSTMLSKTRTIAPSSYQTTRI